MHKVEFLQTGQDMLKVAEKLENKSFYLRLNVSPNAADAVANDVRYHLKCQVKIQPLIDPKKDLQELDDFKQVASDIESTSFAKYQLSNPAGLIMDTNTLNEAYKKKLKEFEVEKREVKNNNKPYIKQLIKENIPSAEIVKSPRRNEPERVCSKQTNTQQIQFSKILTKLLKVH